MVFRPYTRRRESLTVCRCHKTKAALSFQVFKDPECWSGGGLNLWPPTQQTGALPTELTRRGLKYLDRVDQARQAEISVCIEKSWPGQEGDLTIEKGQVTLLAQPTFCSSCNRSPHFVRKYVPHPSCRASVSGSPCVSGKQVTFLSSRILLHTNRGFSAPGASLRGRRRKTRGRRGKRGEGLPRLSNVMRFRGFATKAPKAIGLTKLKGRPFFPFSSPLFVYTVVLPGDFYCAFRPMICRFLLAPRSLIPV